MVSSFPFKTMTCQTTRSSRFLFLGLAILPPFAILAIVPLFIVDSNVIASNGTYHRCLRNCVKNATMTCEYKFTLENFVTMGRSCESCDPWKTRLQLAREPDCQCVRGDGFERGVLTINRMIPGPSIQVCKGDTIIVDVDNSMDGTETTIHWHGQHQFGSQYYDGVPFVTQCPIHSGNKFRYKFKADKAGTHFYHSHSGVQKIDGLYGSLIVRTPPSEDPHRDLYDNDLPEHTIVISDFFHDSAEQRVPGLSGRDPGQYPETLLLNGRGRFFDRETNRETEVEYEEIKVKPGGRYRLRLINAMGTTCDAQFTIEDHPLTVLSTDGDDLVAFTVDSLVSYSGERYDVVIDARNTPRSYWIQVYSEECSKKHVYQLGVLRYEDSTIKIEAEPPGPKPSYTHPLPSGKMYKMDCNAPKARSRSRHRCILDVRSINPVDPDITKSTPDTSLYLPYELLYYSGSEPFVPSTYKHFIVPPSTHPITGLIDDISYTSPHVPPLSQPEDLESSSLCNSRKNLPPECATKQTCICPHTVDLRLGDVVELILVDYSDNRNTSLTHPFHLHGHSFHVLDYGQVRPELIIGQKVMDPIIDAYHRRLETGLIVDPPAKDTLLIPHNGYAILRVKVYNPGYWFFHCHFTYHMVIGMSMIFHVGEVDDLPAVPKNFPRCGDFLPD